MAHRSPTTAGSLDLLDGMPDRVVTRARRLLTIVDIVPGTVLGRQGTVGREFLAVLDGSVAVVVDGAPIAVVTAGGHFGEVALLDRVTNPRRRAGFHALSRCRLAVANRREFGGLLRLSPEIGGRIRQRADRRRGYLDSLDRERLVGTGRHQLN